VINSDRTELAELVRDIHGRGWTPGTGGNFSKLLSRKPMRLLITSSGIDKGQTDEESLLEVDEKGNPLSGDRKPSAETLLHVAIYEKTDAEVVVHTHTVWNTLASLVDPAAFLEDDGCYQLTGFEMLKGLRGVQTHQDHEQVPILHNSQDMAMLSDMVRTTLENLPETHGFLLSGHGLYTWGRDISEARRHLEVFEFLFEVSIRKQSLRK
jgi:methylthioribulose-1-phosphate dehydratase